MQKHMLRKISKTVYTLDLFKNWILILTQFSKTVCRDFTAVKRVSVIMIKMRNNQYSISSNGTALL